MLCVEHSTDQLFAATKKEIGALPLSHRGNKQDSLRENWALKHTPCLHKLDSSVPKRR